MNRRTPRALLRLILGVTVPIAIGLVTAEFAALGGTAQTTSDSAATRFETRQINEHFWGEGATSADINRDGRMDIVSGPFWYEGPGFRARHDYAPATQFFERTRPDGRVVTIPGFEGALGAR